MADAAAIVHLCPGETASQGELLCDSAAPSSDILFVRFVGRPSCFSTYHSQDTLFLPVISISALQFPSTILSQALSPPRSEMAAR
jgi:hypothetical protein